ncbi:MAG: ATP-binding cassette domain-containing protein, partial [Bacteroidales bacterium]|nr:ATP-binding cassette domain-containing protein [Bacteroidales bacterium]
VLRRVDLGSPVSEVIGTMAVVCILMVGGYYILGGRGVLSPEAFITYLLTMTMILQPAKNLTTAYYSIQRGKGSVRRVKEILFADEVIREAEHPVALPAFESAIEWRNVSFRYGDTEAVSQIDLRIPKGKYVAIVGPSGSGKSTLINMIPRFYDAAEGEVLIDGRNIRDYRIDDVRQLSALVSQDTVLFNDTIFNNIQLGNRQASVLDVKRAAEEANAMDFIRESENGFKTLIGDGGCKLSGGQRQRLGIARALLKNAPILILDEASSALDTESESMIQQALERQTGARERTIISVAHRLSTIQHADEIIVMDKGRIVERGTHEALLQAGGLYTRLCKMQQVD